jgi:hypothetical protein
VRDRRPGVGYSPSISAAHVLRGTTDPRWSDYVAARYVEMLEDGTPSVLEALDVLWRPAAQPAA